VGIARLSILLLLACTALACNRGTKSKATALSAARDSTCLVTGDGRVFCFGDDAYRSQTKSASQIKPGKRNTPQQVAVPGKATDVGVMSTTSCARLDSGAVRCWLDRAYENDESLRYLHMDVSIGPLSKIWVSDAAICGLRDGALVCADVERGSFPKTAKPVADTGPIAEASMLDASTGCVRRVDGTVKCTRLAIAGQTSEQSSVEGISGAKSLSVLSGHACAVVADGRVLCWGSNYDGEAGQPATGRIGDPSPSVPRPSPVDGIKDAVSVRTSNHHSCAIDGKGDVYCWGDNRFGQLGNPRSAHAGPVGTFDWVATKVAGVSHAHSLALGEWHSCALLENGGVFCWGRNHRGQLGDGTNKDRSEPRSIRDPS
jgi:hypothetical protein